MTDATMNDNDRPRIINPAAPSKRAWDILVSAAALVSLVVFPLVLSLNLGKRGSILALDIVINLIFIADIIVSFRTAYPEGHRLVRDPVRIRRRYLRTWFIPDLLAALPLFLLFGSQAVILNRVFRFLRLVRLLKIFTLFRTINRIRHTKVSSNVLRIVLMGFWLLLTAHLIACGFIMAGGIEAGLGPGLTYLQALYWTVTTLATVGYGDITPDRNNPLQLVFTITAQIAGVGMYGLVIGSISSVIANIDISKTMYMERMEKIYSFLRYRNISEKVVRRVEDYYDYLWESRRGHEEAHILEELPKSIRLQIAREIHSEIIGKVPMFKEASPAFIRDIVLHLDPLVFTPGDHIIRAGEIGDEMYFINRGYVQVMSEDEKTVFATLGEGAFFGEIALLLSAPRTATVKAGDYCDLYALSKSSFDHILTRHPVFAATVAELAEKRRRELERGDAPALPC